MISIDKFNLNHI